MRSRLAGLDCLRGLAAVVVLLVHYSARFKELYPEVSTVAWTIPRIYAEYAVQLFFAISGFVIFMTLERVEKPIDFIKSRFFRLYPPFWAAATFTFLLLLFVDLPGREVSLLSYFVNLTMIPKVLSLRTVGFPYVDGVYWTLEREFFFYVIIVIVLALNAKQSIHWFVLGFLVWSYIFRHIPFPDKFWKFKIQIVTLAMYFKYFALGMSLYCMIKNHHRWIYLGLSAFGLVRAFALDGKAGAFVFLLIGGLIYGAVRIQRLPKVLSPLAFAGTISYSLYLVHQNLGYVILRELASRNFSVGTSFTVAIISSVLAAMALYYGVEKPTMSWRKKHSQRRDDRSKETNAVRVARVPPHH